MFTGSQSENINIDMKEALKEAISICEGALFNVRRQRIYYLLISFILVIPLIWSMGLDYLITNFGMSIGFNLLRLFLTAILCYVLFMSSIWNNLEQNALKAWCSTMELHLIKSSNSNESDI
jgi:sphingomyelin phosphodiesterase 2